MSGVEKKKSGGDLIYCPFILSSLPAQFEIWNGVVYRCPFSQKFGRNCFVGVKK
uniref:Uncharacterized protein n=1 Tax=Meloidogyne incognita TaxID=6306 RepID=A0A914MEY0_MELIC